MKLIVFSASILVLFSMAQACSHPKYAADKLPTKQIRWGNGGGFVGKETSHILCDNGQIFSRDILGATTAAGKTRSKKAKALFKTAETLGLAKMEMNQPGNIYYFLEFQDLDMMSRVVWGDKNVPVAKPAEDFFRDLNSLLKK